MLNQCKDCIHKEVCSIKKSYEINNPMLASKSVPEKCKHYHYHNEKMKSVCESLDRQFYKTGHVGMK